MINEKQAPAVGNIFVGDIIVSVNGTVMKGKRHQLVHDVCNTANVGDTVSLRKTKPFFEKALACEPTPDSPADGLEETGAQRIWPPQQCSPGRGGA